MKMKVEQYQYDRAYGALYEYNEEHSAYLFAATFDGHYALTEEEAIAQYEEDHRDDHIYCSACNRYIDELKE